MYIILAWRNMWRSRKRSLITISSIFFAVISAILMRVMVLGIFDKMIADTVSISCGYLQIHHIGYWNNKCIDSSFERNLQLEQLLNNQKVITAWTPHLESFALASSGEHTKGILVTGINPMQEDKIAHLSRKLVSGRFLKEKDTAILLAEGLALYLKLKVNDTIVLLSQGYHGSLAAAKYPVVGIVKLAIPEMNKGLAWLPIEQCNAFLGVENRLTGISVMIRKRESLQAVKSNLTDKTAGMNYEVMTWQEMVPDMDQLFQAKMAQNSIMCGILYLVIAFGIFGTILMMLNERMHEFGILIAIGMKKNILAAIVVLEMVIMSIAGAFLGMFGAYPLVYYFWLHPIRMGGDMAKMCEQFNIEPIIQPTMGLSNFVIQSYVVLLIAVVLSLYAVLKIKSIKAIEAINS